MKRWFRYALWVTALLSGGSTLVGTLIIGAAGFDAVVNRSQTISPTDAALVLAVSGLMAVFGALALSWWLSKLLDQVLSDRLAPFVALSRRIAAGDLTGRIAVREHDELGELAYAFGQMTEALAQAQVERDTYLAAVAHDLRMPLTALAGNLEGMIAGVIVPEPERLEVLHREVERLIRQVSDLLTLAGAAAGSLPPLDRHDTDLAALTRALVDRFEPLAAARQIQLTPVIGQPGWGWVDADRMDSVLTNLVNNALTYSPPHTAVTVACWKDDRGGVVWEVRDGGPGIPPELADRVKSPFVRGDVARGRQAGSGLGLTMADFWTRMHGGRLTIGSAGAGAGAVVRVEIPGARPASPGEEG